MAESERPDAVFVSKRDWWISAILWLGMFVMASGIVPALMVSKNSMEVVFLLAFTAGVSAFMMWILYGTRYTFHGGDLVIRSGPFRWTRKVHAIRAVEPTNNPLSSPACSLDRLKIDFDDSRWGIMISPLDKSGFLSELAARNSALEIEGERARRRTT